MGEDSENSHRRLEAEAKATKLKPVQSITSYIALHQNIRRLMGQESYPNVTNERPSVRFAVNGIDGHHEFREAAQALRLTGRPESLRTLEELLLEEDLSMAKWPTARLLACTVRTMITQ